MLYRKPVDDLVLLLLALLLYLFYYRVLINLTNPIGTPKLARRGCYNAFISYKITLYSIDSRLIDTSLFNNILRALAKEEQAGDIDLFRGRKNMLIYSLLVRE